MKKIIYITVLLVILLMVPGTVKISSAQDEVYNEMQKYLRTFRSVYQVSFEQQPVVPSVVKIRVNDDVLNRNINSLLMVENGNKPVAHAIEEEVPSREMKFDAYSVAVEPDLNEDILSLHDGNILSYHDLVFPPGLRSEKIVQIRIRYFNSRITTSMLRFQLAPNTQLPYAASIQELSQDSRKIILSKADVTGSTILFPVISNANDFLIEFYITQPLRLSEIGFVDMNQKSTRYIRFLAQPNSQYSIYADPDGSYIPKVTLVNELGDLFRIESVIYGNVTRTANSLYRESDRDDDGVSDSKDNCLTVSNADQIDKNNNLKGDACEDFDGDGVLNSVDNCPDLPNRNQQDEDGDKIGDFCDPSESRWIEKYRFIPWLGVVVGFVLVGLIFKSSHSIRHPEVSDSENLKNHDQKLQ